MGDCNNDRQIRIAVYREIHKVMVTAWNDWENDIRRTVMDYRKAVFYKNQPRQAKNWRRITGVKVNWVKKTNRIRKMILAGVAQLTKVIEMIRELELIFTPQLTPAFRQTTPVIQKRNHRRLYRNPGSESIENATQRASKGGISTNIYCLY